MVIGYKFTTTICTASDCLSTPMGAEISTGVQLSKSQLTETLPVPITVSNQIQNINPVVGNEDILIIFCKGCSQGGVLSPLYYGQLFLLKIIKLLCRSMMLDMKDMKTICLVSCVEISLSVNSDNTVMVLFTKTEGLPNQQSSTSN